MKLVRRFLLKIKGQRLRRAIFSYSLILLFSCIGGGVANAADPAVPFNWTGATAAAKSGLRAVSAPLAAVATPGYVPVEAKAGKFFMESLSFVAASVYESLIPFLNVFVIALFAFWILMESWQMMTTGGDTFDLMKRIVMKGAGVAVWMWVLNHNPSEMFMWIAGPVISIGTGAAELIMQSTAKIAGADLPDTCTAIRDWIAAGGDVKMLVSPTQAADLLCLPTMAGAFFITAVKSGFDWMIAGLGHSGVEFLMGLIFVILFIYNIWKFALAALGVIVDLFFVLMFLPFTAIKECFKGGTTYKGMWAPIWDAFVGLVGGEELGKQFQKFVSAAIYFAALSVVCAIAVILMAGVNPAFGGDAISVLIVGCMSAYLIGKADDLAKKMGGGIDNSFGDEIAANAKNIWGGAVDFGKRVVKIIKK
ncbi:MAG: hypothetical protein LBL46_04940 [Rickettsiales bacterium]|jgi:hypothetical protein|nr:hypothetical protein [Rickettsiales bacterium]